MELFDQSISPIVTILSFIFGVVGAWDKVKALMLGYRLKRTERKILRAEKQLNRLDKLSRSPNYLIATMMLHLFKFLTIILFMLVVNFQQYTDTTHYFLAFTVFCNTVMSWLSGYFIGGALHDINLVLKQETKKEKLIEKIKSYQASRVTV